MALASLAVDSRKSAQWPSVRAIMQARSLVTEAFCASVCPQRKLRQVKTGALDLQLAEGCLRSVCVIKNLMRQTQEEQQIVRHGPVRVKVPAAQSRSAQVSAIL